MACDLVCVHPVAIEDIWPHARGFIESAFARERGDDDANIVLAELKAQTSVLWLVWERDDRAILAALTTKLIKTPRGIVCQITSCGGVELDRWAGLLAKVEAYAKAEGCMSVRIEGRKGWKGYFPDYNERWVMLEKRL
jgi:hypothetical protein